MHIYFILNVDPQNVSMTRERHNPTLKTKPQHDEEVTKDTNRHMTSRIQLKSSNQLSEPQQDEEVTQDTNRHMAAII